MIDVSEAAGFGKKGIVTTDDDGNVLLYITTVSGDPTGTPAPVNTWVFREDTKELYRKFGSNDGDWENQTVNVGTVPRELTKDLIVKAKEQLLVAENVCIGDGVLIDLEQGGEVNVL